MDIEIRRNRDIKFDFEMSEEQRETILDFFKPKVIDEMVEQMLDENNRLKREICEKIMAHCVEIGQRDLNGNLITPDTHEVDFDLGFVNINGDTWAYPKQWYVRPKKSEYEIGNMKPTIEEVLYSAKALLRELEQVDPDGVRYYEQEEAKYLERLIDKYEKTDS